MSTYRYAVEDDGTIYRACVTREGDDSGDNWRWYWEGDEVAAFVVHYGVRLDVTLLGDEDWSERAYAAWRAARMGERGADNALDTLAPRLTGNPDSRFICVGLDRDADLYALAWNGDPDNEWGDEIEALNAGEVYRIEVDKYVPLSTLGWQCWVEQDPDGETYYGEGNAENALVKAYPLTEFPAEQFIFASA